MAKTPNVPKTFESAITELETIVQEMETGTISLEQALERYHRGVTLLKYCQETLQGAEHRIQQLEAGILAPVNPEDESRSAE